MKSGVEDRELAFNGLRDRCIEKKIGEYNYKICHSVFVTEDFWEREGVCHLSFSFQIFFPVGLF